MSRRLAHQSAMKKQERKSLMFKKMGVKKRRCVCCVFRGLQCSAVQCIAGHFTSHTYLPIWSPGTGRVFPPPLFLFQYSRYIIQLQSGFPDSSTCSRVADYTPIHPYIVIIVKRQMNFNARAMSWVNFSPHHHHRHHHVKPL